jgi:hypothetical protein
LVDRFITLNYILYIHSKGVTKSDNKCIKDWVNYLTYFNIYKFNDCLNKLNDYDCVGVNLKVGDDNPLHYSGNFWWSKGSHIKKLNKITDNMYNSSEFWVTSLSDKKYASLWNSNINHYFELYDSSLYS